MRRILLLATLMLGGLAAVPSLASADFGSSNFPYFGQTTGGGAEATVLSSSGTPANTGPKVGFPVRYECTGGEFAVFAAYVAGTGDSSAPEGGGVGPTTMCSGIGQTQEIFVIAQANGGSPPFDVGQGGICLRGFGFTGGTSNNLTDLQTNNDNDVFNGGQALQYAGGPFKSCA